jgi:glutathione reductase (NADPH)
MNQFDVDLFVIGAGSGGVRAARVAARHGARVAIAEGANYGGTCVHRGCVPKKLMVYASRFPDQFKASEGYGWSSEPSKFDWSRLIANKDVELARLEGIYRRTLHDAGVQAFNEDAALVDEHTVELRVSGKRISASKILIATGGVPDRQRFEGADLAITSDEVFHLESLPARVMVVGGGYIATEFASIFRGLGSEVTQLVRAPSMLRGFDDDIVAVLDEQLRARGVRLQMNENVEQIRSRNGALHVTTTGGQELDVDVVLLSTGRHPNTRNLGLDAVGVVVDSRGAVVVDSIGQTNVPSIFAVGDVTNRLNLTPVAIREGQAFADRHFGNLGVAELDYTRVPTAVFTTPEVGVVGMSEKLARAQFNRVRVLKTQFRPMDTSFAGLQDQFAMKVVINEDTDRVVGVHLLGEGAAEMIQMVGVALTAGATWAQFRHTVALHPTIAEELVTLKG